jgi:hypothetical protein
MYIPEALRNKKYAKYSLTDLVFLVFLKAQEKNIWLTFEDIQNKILNVYRANGFSEGYIMKNKFYGTPTISAAIRNIRKPNARWDYELPDFDEVVIKRKKSNSKGYEYQLIIGEDYGKETKYDLFK